MREIAVAVQNENQQVGVEETIRSIKKAGFENVFVQWYDEDWEISQEAQIEMCKKIGLHIEFAHLGYHGINAIWLEGEEGERFVERYQKDIKDCKENGISLVVMHLVSRRNPPQYGEIGLERIRKITQYARELGVKVAFENTAIKGYLEYVLENIQDDNVGMCLDSGHLHVFFDDEFNFELAKNRIFAVHLHDNDQSDDLHLLPFDGTVNWKFIVQKLKECNYGGPVTLEITYRYDYLKKSLDEFYQKGYRVGCELASQFENQKTLLLDKI